MDLSIEDLAALSSLFDACSDLDTSRRAVWLSALPQSQRHLVPLLEQMLTATTSGASNWTLPPLALAGPAGGNAGQRVGPYRLLRQVGTGGMGSVWLAERADGQFDRRVALKMPHQSWLPGLAARMARERRIGALLEHPHIARLYDAGVDEQGRSYIAMEYVDGMPIDAWCAEHACTPAQLLALFVQVVRAVAYAHGRLVVHRDLKPANILVSRDAEARLLDFGIAKLIEEAATGPSLTQDLGRMMTRRYASPEQITGASVGVATDIYSLGVTLYELLTGTSPYATVRDTPAALEEAILAGGLPLASSRVRDLKRRRALRGDLDAILGKALALDPLARYPSADSMADDIERHLAGERIGARPASWLYGVRLRVRRHRIALLLTGVLLAAGAAGIGATWLQARRAAQEAERAHIITAFVSDLFRIHADGSLQGLSGRDKAADSGSITPTGSIAHPVAALIETRFANRPDLRAHLYGAVAQVYADLSLGQPALEFASLQWQWLERLGADRPTRAAALLLLARAYTVQRRYGQAESQARAAVALLPDARSEEGLEARAVLAGILLPNGAKDEVKAIIEEVQRSLPLASRPASIALARMFEVQGTLAEIENRFDEAVALWKRALGMAIAVEGPASRRGNAIRLRLALEELGRNRLVDARRNLADYIEAVTHAGFAGRIQATMAATRFAAVGVAMGRISHAEASAVYKDAHRVVVEAGSALPAHVLANIEVRQGALALQYGDLQTARRLLHRAIPVAQAASDGLIDARGFASHLGMLAMTAGHHDEAAVHLEKRRDLRVRSGDGLTPFAAFDWVLLAHNELMRGDPRAALAVLSRAPDFAANSGDQHAAGQEYRHAIAEQRARIALHEGDAAAALAALPADYGAQPFVDVSLPTLAPYALRGEVLCAAGRPAEGLPYMIASIRAVAEAQTPLSPALARLHAAAGHCALLQGDRDMARRMAALSRPAFAGQPQVSSWYRRPLTALEAALAANPRPAPARAAAAIV